MTRALPLALLLAGCANGIRIGGTQMVPQQCTVPLKPVLLSWSHDVSMCARHNQTPWGACITCDERDDFRICTIHAQGMPNQVGPDAMYDEMQHAFNCDHIHPIIGGQT